MLGYLMPLWLAFGPGFGREVAAPEDGRRFAPPALEPGFDPYEGWNDLWRRFEDRHGRPDARGPLLQPAPELQRPEYELSLAVAEHPLYFERDWNRRTRGARVWIHSDDEFSFFNEVRAKERIPMGKAAALGLRYDRLELREVKSSMFQLVFAFPDIAGTGLFIELRPVARFEKPDLDVELAVGWADRERGRVQARVFSFDTFNDASDALAANRDTIPDLRVIQREPLFGVAAEAELFAIPQLRASIYVGGVIPAKQSYYFEQDYAADPDNLFADGAGSDGWIGDRHRTQSATLGGGWIEWAIPQTPIQIGVTGTRVDTRQLDRNDAGALLDWVREHETRFRAYGLIRVDDDVIPKFLGSLIVEGVASYRLTQLPDHHSEYGSVTRDRSWLAMIRAEWMPTRVFGLELGYLMIDRAAEGTGFVAPYLTEANHRVSTRFALAFEPHVWITFGVGWDVDERNGPYDQGGMTLTGRW